MTRDEKPKRLRFLRSQKTMIVRAMRGAAPTAVLAVCALAGAQAALADQPGRVQISFETSGLKAEAPEAEALRDEAFQGKALSAEELTGVRGAGLEAGAPGRDGRRDTAVILFDEIGGKRGGSGNTKLSHDAGLGSSLNQSVSSGVY